MSNIYELVVEKREYFNAKKADKKTLELRRKAIANKDDLFLLPIKTGKKTWYFGGAGKHKLMLYKIESGADVSDVSVGKFWVLWNNVNKIIRDKILTEIKRLNGEYDVSEEEEQPEEIIQEGEPGFVKASEL